MIIRRDPSQIRRNIRKREIKIIFQNVKDNSFDKILELGAGDGYQAQILSCYTKLLMSTELTSERLIKRFNPKIIYDTCDAEDIKYQSGQFDLIYSSNLLEHLSEVQKSLKGMRRVLKDDGIMIHSVPNRFWKTLDLLFFYPNKLLRLLEKTMGERRTIGQIYPNNLRGVKRAGFLRRNLWPNVHGSSHSNLEEFFVFGKNCWVEQFVKAGFDVMKIIEHLPVHSPYRFGLDKLRTFFEKLGFSSCTAFVVKKGNHSSPYGYYFKSIR